MSETEESTARWCDEAYVDLRGIRDCSNQVGDVVTNLLTKTEQDIAGMFVNLGPHVLHRVIPLARKVYLLLFWGTPGKLYKGVQILEWDAE